MGSATLTQAPVTSLVAFPTRVLKTPSRALTWALTWAPIAWWHGLQVPDMGSKRAGLDAYVWI